MGLFDGKETAKRFSTLEKNVEKLEKSNNILAKNINEIKVFVSESTKRSPEFEKESMQASRKVSEFRNRASETLEEINLLFETVKIKSAEIEKIKEELNSTKSEINEDYNLFLEEKEKIEIATNEILEKNSLLETKITTIEEVFENHPELLEELEELENFSNKIEENFDKSSQLLKSVTSRKGEIDRLHREIIGFDEEDEETGEKTHVNGLKDDLKDTYEDLDAKTNFLTSKIEEIENETETNYNNFIEESEVSNKRLSDNWEQKYTDLNRKIQSLLPNALTAGLSYAFSEKKDTEVQSYQEHAKQFRYGIIGLVVVSLIPFILSICFIANDDKWDLVIDRVPRIVLAIIPLYIPVLWLAWTSSKKMNLSKRLIEEYSHKEVLSKTFEGLSSQINDLEDDGISSDLRISLLQNFLQVYSENPGKLISNYNSSDHPVSEILDNTYKLEGSIEKLNKIPGISKLLEIAKNKSEKKVEEAVEKVNSGLERINDSEINPN